MNKTFKRLVIGLMLSVSFLTSCRREADTASFNISREADEFRVVRRVVFYNSITDTYILEMVGNLSIKADRADNQLEVTAKIGPNKYQKHFLGLSDNVTYSVEQLGVSDVDAYRYKVIFKPQSILPIDLEIKVGEDGYPLRDTEETTVVEP